MTAVSDHKPTFAILGAGGRGGGYAAWLHEHPDRGTVVAVADPNPVRRNRLADEHQIPAERRFETWQDLLAAGERSGAKLADAVTVTTQDKDHVAPAVAFAGAGYHLLLEKPMAPDPEGCRTIVDAVAKAGVMLGVCHVMRYTPYTQTLKRILDEGRIGDIVSIQHLEPVGFWHQAHSFVRGNWRREDESSFMLLAKSCHDIDWLRYIVGKPFSRVSSFGSLTHFRPEEKPEGAGDRCLECAVEPECPYSAKRLYLGNFAQGRTGWPVAAITDEVTEEGITQALKEGPYGRCVYSCDNDVVDHQTVNIEFEGAVTATFTMTAFTEQANRKTQIFGTHGSIDGDGETIRIYDFLTRTTEEIDAYAGGSDAGSGHGGGDSGLMAAYTQALAAGDASRILSGPAESLETHLAVFAAEHARRAGTVEAVTSSA